MLSAGYTDQKVTWYENDGAADNSFTARTITSSAYAARSVYAADIDNDGDMDVLSASALDDKIAWYENDGAGDPSFTTRTITTSADAAASVYAADIDNDGDLDVVSASFTDDKIAWYENGEADVTAPTIASVSLAADNASIAVTMSENVYNTNGGSGNLEAADFSLSISGGNATLSSSTPSSISISGKVYTLGINLSSNMAYGTETLTVTPVANSIYDLAGNAASTSQSNNTATLNGVAQQIGSDINGEAGSDYSGYRVSNNNTAGDRVAIGAYGNDGSASGKKMVRVYALSSGSWTQLGVDMIWRVSSDNSGISTVRLVWRSGRVGSVENDGTSSNAGHVRIYSYNGSEWTQLAVTCSWGGKVTTLKNGIHERSWRSHGGANYNNGNGSADAGHLRVYDTPLVLGLNLAVTSMGRPEQTISGWSASMNAAGDRVAIGALYNDGNGTDFY